MAPTPAPPNPTSSPWLHLAAPVGRVGASFLITSAFSAMLAPLVFLLDPSVYLDPGGPATNLLALFSDPTRVLAISDFLAVIGIVLLTGALFLILLGLVRADRPMSVSTFALGALAFGLLASWVPVMLYAQGRARGTISTVDAAAATGGWGVASVLLLGAAVAYLLFTLRIENGSGARKLTSLWWPAYAAVNVLGSAAIAAFFADGPSSTDAFSLGLVLKVTLIPMLGVMAYGDLKDRFPRWEQVPLMAAPKVKTSAAKPVVEPLPPPPPPMGLPLPPPPDD